MSIEEVAVSNGGTAHAIGHVVSSCSAVSRVIEPPPAGGRVGSGAPEPALHRLEINWRLPEGRHAVPMLCQPYPVPVEGFAEIEVPVSPVGW